MQTYPIFPQRKTLSLDGAWDFAFIQDDHTPLAQLPIPGEFPELQMVPGVFDTDITSHYGKRGVGFYRKTFPFQTNGPLLINVGAIGLAADIWFDGQKVASSQLPYSTFQVDLETVADQTFHTIIFAVDNRFVPQASPIFMPNFDFYGYGGIYRSVSIQEVPANNAIDRVQITTLDYKQGTIRADITFRKPITADVDAAFGFDYGTKAPCTLHVIDGKASCDLIVPNPKIWSVDTPNLHTLQATVGEDEIIERFGLRSFRTEGEKILVNDEPVRLLGACRHECHFNYGPAIPVQQMLDDLKLLKNMGSNFIRCVHYPQDQQFLDLCDEFGILVWQESMGWNNTEADAMNPDFFQLQVEQTRLMVKNSFNHPSIIIWAYMNECNSDKEGFRPLYEAQTATIKSFNPDFLVSYACNRCWGDIPDICLDLCDIVSFNTYPGWIGGNCTWNDESSPLIAPTFARIAEAIDKHPGAKGKPALMSENGCCAFYGAHDFAKAQWSEEYQADYVSTAVKFILESKRFNGFSIWQFIDSRSYVNAAPGVRCKPLGMNLAGLLDEYRRPKLAYFAVKKLYDGENAKNQQHRS